jgi:DNA modification methylase
MWLMRYIKAIVWIGIELNPEYCEIIRRRMAGLEVNLFLAK